jgi:hypothetical protein
VDEVRGPANEPAHTHRVAVIALLHPFADAARSLRQAFAHGNLRHWAAFTLSATALAQETGPSRLDEQIARNVFALHAGGPER